MIASIFEGVGLGVLLILYCLIGIKDGAVGMVHLYDKTVRQRCIELGLTTEEKIKKRAIVNKDDRYTYVRYICACVCVRRQLRSWIFARIFTTVNYFVGVQLDRQIFDRRTVGWSYKGVDNSRYGRFNAVYQN